MRVCAYIARDYKSAAEATSLLSAVASLAINNEKSIVEHSSCYSRVASKRSLGKSLYILELKKNKSIARFVGIKCFVCK